MLATFNYLSSSLMLKKFFRIFCYISLFFVVFVNITSASSIPQSWTFNPNSSYYGIPLNSVAPAFNISTTADSSITIENSSFFNYGKALVTSSDNKRFFRHNLADLTQSPKTVFLGQLRGCDRLSTACGHTFSLLSGTSTSEIEAHSSSHDVCYIKMYNGNILRAGSDSVYFNNLNNPVSTSTPVSWSLTVDTVNQTCKVWFSGVYTNGQSFSTTSIAFPFDSTSYVSIAGITSSEISLYKSSSVSNAEVWSNFSATDYDTTDIPITCSTCTRIISHTPDRGETFATTQDIPIYSEVYVASSDVINQSNIYTKFYWTSIKAPAEFSGKGIGENDPQPSGTHKEQILIFDEPYQTFPHLADFDFATGTYKMKIQILEEIQSPWWQFWINYTEEKELASTEYEFYILQATDYEEMIQLSQQVIAQQEAAALANDCARAGFVSQACFLSYGSELINSIKYAPPHGYAFLLVDKLMATTTGTSSIAMVVSFPEGSPLRGHTLDLNMSSAIGNSISYIDTQDIETLPDGAMNTFMKYWNYFCYIMLGIWIIREVFGTFAFDFSYGGGNYQRSGQLEVTKVRHKGSQPRMHIKSYD